MTSNFPSIAAAIVGFALCVSNPLQAAPAPCNLKGEIAKTERELKQVRQNADAMRRQLQAREAETQRLRHQLADLKHRDGETLVELARGLADAERRSSALERGRSGLEKALAKTEAGLREAQQRRELAEKAIADLAELKTSNEKLKAFAQTAGDQLEQIAKEMVDTSKELEKRTELAEKLQNQNEELNAHLKKAEEQSETRLAEQRILLKREMATQSRAADEARQHAEKLRRELDESRAAHERAMAEQRIVAKREIARHLQAATATAESAAKERAELEKALAEATKKPKTNPEELRAAIAATTAAETELGLFRQRHAALATEVESLTKSTTRARADLVAEQVVRMQLEGRIAELEAKLAAATAEPPAPAKPVTPPKPVALAVLRFDKNATATARDRETLLGQVKELLGAKPGTEFDIVGHTCNTGNAKANQTLSERRADSVRDILVRGGVPADRLHPRGVGQNEPVADNRTLDGRRLNRRVEVHVR